MKVEINGKMMFYIGGSGGAPAPPHPPRLLGLRPRAPLERFAPKTEKEKKIVKKQRKKSR